MFEQMRAMGHERVVVAQDPKTGLQAIIAIHSTLRGPGLGGVRMWPYRSFEEALSDVLALARAMTLKAAAADLPLGGAKAVILGNPQQGKSEELFRAFGRLVDSIGGDYITAEDVGTSAREMDWIAHETPFVTGVSPFRGGAGEPSPSTALGVLCGIRAVARHLWGSPDLKGRTVAIQGLGAVGQHLARGLLEEGAKVYGADLRPSAAEAAAKFGVEIVTPEEILTLPCDVFSPCALGATLHRENIPHLRTRVVAGAANNPLTQPEEDAQLLHTQGVLYVPDFLINSGGLIHVFHEFVGRTHPETETRVRRLEQEIFELLEQAKARNILPLEAAFELANRRLEAAARRQVRAWDQAVARRIVNLR